MDCAFCRIVAAPETAEVVLEGPSVLAFLDHRPLFPGHCLLVPRTHVGTLPDLAEELVGPLFGAARRLAAALPAALEAEGSFLAINNRVSQSVPHLHVHVVPRRRKDGLRGFFWPRHAYRDDAHRREVADRIRAALRA